MTILKHRPHPSEASIPVAKRSRRDDTVPNLAEYHAPPAAHLHDDRDRALSFDDVTPEREVAVRPVRRQLRPDAGRMVLAFLAAADPTEVAMHREFGHHIPLSVGLRTLPLAAVVVDDIDTVAAAIIAAPRDLTRHPRVAAALTAIAEQLDGAL